MRFESTRDIRRRLASWVATKIAGRRFVELADGSIDALRSQLDGRKQLVHVACWCERCDIEANAGFRTRMSV